MRFRVRHVQQTVADHVEAHLVALGWTANPAPWGIKPLRFQEVEPDEVPNLDPTIVSTSIDHVGEDLEQELGGAILAVTYQLLVDVYAEKASVALSIASDIRDALTFEQIPLMDYTPSTPVEAVGAHIEFDAVEIARPTGIASGIDLRKGWRTVLANATCVYTG